MIEMPEKKIEQELKAIARCDKKIIELTEEVKRCKKEWKRSKMAKVEADILASAREKLYHAKRRRESAFEKLSQSCVPSKFSKLTEKQAGFVKDVFVEGKTQMEAIKANYFNKDGSVKDDQSASALGSSVAHNPKVKDAIEELYIEAGLTRLVVGKTIVEALKANQVEFIKGEGLCPTSLPDHNVRLKAATLAVKVLGDEKKARESDQAQVKVNIKINANEQNAIEAGVAEFLKNKFGKKKRVVIDTEAQN